MLQGTLTTHRKQKNKQTKILISVNIKLVSNISQNYALPETPFGQAVQRSFHWESTRKATSRNQSIQPCVAFDFTKAPQWVLSPEMGGNGVILLSSCKSQVLSQSQTEGGCRKNDTGHPGNTGRARGFHRLGWTTDDPSRYSEKKNISPLYRAALLCWEGSHHLASVLSA